MQRQDRAPHVRSCSCALVQFAPASGTNQLPDGRAYAEPRASASWLAHRFRAGTLGTLAIPAVWLDRCLANRECTQKRDDHETRARLGLIEFLRRALFRVIPNCGLKLTLAVRGKDAAYNTLVTAQTTQYGWNRYFTRSENVRYLWAKLKEIYPDKWIMFLQSTLMSDPRNINRSGVTAQACISRLVSFSPVYGAGVACEIRGARRNGWCAGTRTAC